jgi:regulator of sigma E protease
MNFFQTALAFLLALGPLIIFHELGHYLVARWCGVKVLRFSVGIGRVVWSRKVGPDQTEWAISALPLGGYVKMLDAREADGPIDPRDKGREFTGQPVGKRIAIVAAGPVANFLLAIVLYAGLNMYGVQEISSRVRAPEAGTPAAAAGFARGDRIVAVNGKEVASWGELRIELMQAAMDKSAVAMQVERGKERFQLELPAASVAGLDLDSDIPSKLGFAVFQPPALLNSVLPGGPADKIGLQAGDLIVRAGGKAIGDSRDLVEAIRASGAKALPLVVQRRGETFEAGIVPELDAASGRGRIGIGLKEPELVTVTSGPLEAVAKATQKTWDMSVMTVRMIGKMIVGEVSLRNVTGPITIADYAGQTAKAGAVVFLGFIAFISISLGVMNLLPIPVLDGGHLLYYLVEVLTGRPLPERIGEYAQRAGLGLLVMLMALAVFNDVVRLL